MTDSEKIEQLKELVDKQAEVDGLWLEARYIETALIQQALRHIHAVIEGHDDISELTNGYLET